MDGGDDSDFDEALSELLSQAESACQSGFAGVDCEIPTGNIAPPAADEFPDSDDEFDESMLQLLTPPDAVAAGESTDQIRNGVTQIDIFSKVTAIPPTQEIVGPKLKASTEIEQDHLQYGEEPGSSLNDFGKDIERITSDPSRRSLTSFGAHSLRPTRSNPAVVSEIWKKKTILEGSPPSKLKVSVLEKQDILDCFGIKVKKPLISSTTLAQMMEGRRSFSPRDLKASVAREGDWSLFAVVLSKSEAKKSQKGSVFSIWTLSDLRYDQKGQVEMVSLFLFGQAHKELWKTPTGVVIGVLSPSGMENRQDVKSGKQSESNPAVSIFQADRVLLLGTAKDLAFCPAKRKSDGRICNQPINGALSLNCAFHVMSGYKKSSGRRSELQATFSGGRIPRKFMATSDDNTMTSPALFGPNTKSAPWQVNLKAFTSTTKLGAKNIDAFKLQKQTEVQTSVVTKPSKALCRSDSGSSSGTGNSGSSSKPKSALQLLREESDARLSKPKPSTSAVVVKESSKFRPWAAEMSPLGVRSSKASSAADLNKAKALAAIRVHGPIEKVDPNDIRAGKKRKVAEAELEVTVEDDQGGDKELTLWSGRALPGGDIAALIAQKRNARFKKTASSQAPVSSKKITDDLRKLMEKGSMFSHLVDSEEKRKEEAYFDRVEKSEIKQQQMENIWEAEVKVVICGICKYRAVGQSDLCREEGHQVHRSKGIRRWFKCKKCSFKTATIDKVPRKECQKCGETNWERAPMGSAKKGPAIGGETLLLRGSEEKFLGSTPKQMNLNV